MYCFVAGRRKIDFPGTAIKHAKKPEQTKENTSCNWIIKHLKFSMYAHVQQGEIPLHFTLLPLSQVKGQWTRIESRIKHQNPWAWRIIIRRGWRAAWEQHPVPCWVLGRATGRDSPWEPSRDGRDCEKEGKENSSWMETPPRSLRLTRKWGQKICFKALSSQI